MSINCFLHALHISSAIHESYDDILRGGDELNVTLKSELIFVCFIHTLTLGASKYEYPFLGRRHTSR